MPAPSEKQLSDEQSRAVAAMVREELARRRISRQRLADQAKISISTLEKALAGRRPFTLATTIRLEEARSKSGRPRVFPFGLAPSLKTLLDARWASRDGLYVFHRHGKRIKDFRTAWQLACQRAGLVGRIPHDLRRSAARDLRRAGVSEGEIMKLCGWRTRSMFDRYNIIDEQDLAAAVAKRFAPAPEPAPTA